MDITKNKQIASELKEIKNRLEKVYKLFENHDDNMLFIIKSLEEQIDYRLYMSLK